MKNISIIENLESKLNLWLLIPILLFAIIGAFAKIMTSFNHNEHMYIAASVLLTQGKIIYQDFAYLQTPYLPLLYSTIFKLFGVNSFYLLIGKLISFLFLSISSISVFFITYRVLNNITFSIGISTLFLLNTNIINSSIETSNYIAPLAFSIISFYIFIFSTENQIKPFGIALAGLFLAIAIGMKLTYITLIIPFIAIILFYPLKQHVVTMSSIRKIHYILLLFIAGLVIGLLPMLFFLFSNVESFLFNNLMYHHINTRWRQITGYMGPMSMYSKLSYAMQIFSQSDNLSILFGILLGFGFFIKQGIKPIQQTIKTATLGLLLAFLLALIALLTALAPTPAFAQYFSTPLIFLLILLTYLLTYLLTRILYYLY